MSRDESLSTSSPRYAVWKRRPEDPRTPRGWILWGDRHMTQAERRSLGRLLLGSAGLLAFAIFFMGAGALFLGLITTWLVATLYARPGAREHAKLPDLSGEKAYPVTLTVLHNGRKVGRENGWVAFVDGWIVYEGLRTSFSVRALDVQSKLPTSGSIDLSFPTMGSARLRILSDYMQTNRPAKLGSRAALDAAHDLWRSMPIPEGRPIFPPIGYSPRVLGERAAENLLGGLVLILLFYLSVALGSFFGGLFTGFGAIICFLSAVRAFRALRKILGQGSLPSAPVAIEGVKPLIDGS